MERKRPSKAGKYIKTVILNLCENFQSSCINILRINKNIDILNSSIPYCMVNIKMRFSAIKSPYLYVYFLGL